MIRDAVLPIIRDPQSALTLDLPGWDILLRETRAANLMARLAKDLAETDGRFERLPAEVRPHLLAAQRIAQRQYIATLAEIERVQEALEGNVRLVLLKGAAYLAADLPVARGRIFGDIDLLVPRAQLVETEALLLKHGWISAHHNTYDQRYYREWMHELPPLQHVMRQSTLDVHHNILPSTSRHPPDPELLLQAAVETPRLPGVFVLAPADMVLHSASHLFHEGELDNGLRDLVDLDGLLRHFGNRANFWDELTERANALHLEQPMRYALRMCQLLLGTPFPASLLTDDAHWPADFRERLLEQLYSRGLRPNHALAGDRWTPLARWLLYVRGHWLRMPPHLLTAHLLRKAWRSLTGLESEEDEAQTHAKPLPTDKG